ncbi:D-alanyl-D-alanine carboxypeptidase [Fertoebacter nigrum]|uniref:D-alanyl-D-alanine carboxypeptidase n=1 Tax=Fertoeibacter niger TaxID=2656921 RepID=A0A8X8GYS8_9RHOB|nr:serine hydrolase [Fertoeibacter niger]NUB46749.1 D-alanyl-D-alanine carboxypeptidase [Fertoeibacter niger]
MIPGLLLFVSLLIGSAVHADDPSFVVVDARDGNTLIAHNADKPKPPGAIMQVMTLFVAWSLAEAGELDLDASTTISARAQMEPPLRIGLKAGQVVPFRRLIEFVAGQRSNDAATALAEGISGSVDAFARRMNDMANLMCLTNSHFLANYGLARPGQITTAQDAAIIARHLLHRFPENLPLFAVPGVKHDGVTRRNILSTVRPDLDGFTTMYTLEAGHGGVFTVERNGVRLIVVIMGASDPAMRRRMLGDLLDQGFAAAKPIVPVAPPRLDGCPMS